MSEVGRIGRREVHDGRIVKLSVDRVRFPDGSEGDLEFIRHPGASAILPFLDDPRGDDPKVLLLRQYRYAAGGELWELPAGLPDGEGESWRACAVRELEEETGYRARELRYLTRIYTTPGFTDEVIHLFAAAGLEPGETGRDEDEFIEVVPLRLSQVWTMVREGTIIDAKSLSALLFWRAFGLEAWAAEVPAPPR